MNHPPILPFALLIACGSAADDPADDGGDADVDGPMIVACDIPELVCTDPTPVNPTTGNHALRLPVSWTYCEESQLSYAQPIYLDVGENVTGLSLTIDQGEVKTGFALVDTEGLEQITSAKLGLPPFKHDPLSVPASTVAMPINDVTYPDPGCMAVVPIAAGDVSSETGLLHVVSRVGDPTGVIDLDLVVVDGVDVTLDELDDAVAVVTGLYANANALTIGQVDLFNTDIVPDLINFDGADVNLLRTESVDDRMTVFFISDVLDAPGTLGWAAGVPGPNGIGATASSGVIIAVDSHRFIDGSIDTHTMGETIAHEIGHQLGLFHTTEPDGTSHDPIADTPNCTPANDLNADGQLSAEECLHLDGAHMMFWTAGPPQTRISPTQSDVLFFTPLAR